MMPNYNPDHLWWPLGENTPKKSKMIPKIIHQMWIGENPPMNLINTWKEQNPGWKHILWTDKTLKEWKFRNQEKLDYMSEPNGKCDIMRYEILHRMGGFFVDADTICIRPLENKLFEYDCMSVYEGEKQRGGLIACGFMACQPRCELMNLCIEGIDKVASPAWWYVGPAYFTHIVQSNKYPIKVHPSHYFIPKHYAGSMYTGPGPVYCDHLWGVTYEGGYERFVGLNPKPVQVQRPAIQRRQPGLQMAGICRRMGILCQVRHLLPGQAPDHSQLQDGQPCSRVPNSATQLVRERSLS